MNCKTCFTTLCLCCLSLFCASPLSAKTATEKMKEKIREIPHKFPKVNLLSNEVNYEGLKIQNFHFDTGKNYTIVKPGEEVTAEFSYYVDKNALDTLKIDHFVYGLYPHKALGCFMHSLGLFNREGTSKLSFKAPEKKGVYEFKISHTGQRSFKDIENEWSSKENNSEDPTIGLLIVE